jgi:hypothetical protein
VQVPSCLAIGVTNESGDKVVDLRLHYSCLACGDNFSVVQLESSWDPLLSLAGICSGVVRECIFKSSSEDLYIRAMAPRCEVVSVV